MSPDGNPSCPGVSSDESLQKKLGQLVCVGFHGTRLTDPAVAHLIQQAEAGLIGGVIIYRYNIIDRTQLTQLLAGIHGARTEFPLFVFVSLRIGCTIFLFADEALYLVFAPSVGVEFGRCAAGGVDCRDGRFCPAAAAALCCGADLGRGF